MAPPRLDADVREERVNLTGGDRSRRSARNCKCDQGSDARFLPSGWLRYSLSGGHPPRQRHSLPHVLAHDCQVSCRRHSLLRAARQLRGRCADALGTIATWHPSSTELPAVPQEPATMIS